MDKLIDVHVKRRIKIYLVPDCACTLLLNSKRWDVVNECIDCDVGDRSVSVVRTVMVVEAEEELGVALTGSVGEG